MHLSIRYKVLLYWLLLCSLIFFGFFLSWDLGVLQSIIQQDNTRVCLIILFLLIGMSCHCGYRSIYLSLQFKMLEQFYSIDRSQKCFQGRLFPKGESLAQEYLFGSSANVIDETTLQRDKSLLAELLVEETSGPHQVGWFVVGGMIKLGLLGTVIGFIVMLSSVSGLENLTIADVKDLMQRMTEGMGIAMSTTLIGLIGSILLSTQYLLLDRMADRFVAMNIRLGEEFKAQTGEPLEVAL